MMRGAPLAQWQSSRSNDPAATGSIPVERTITQQETDYDHLALTVTGSSRKTH